MNSQLSSEKTRTPGSCCCGSKSSPSVERPEQNLAGFGGLPLHQLQVKGASCGGCVRTIEKALRSIAGVKDAGMDLNSGIASVIGTVNENDLVDALDHVGYSASVI